jgi:GT2 family glycosyltransferase
VQIWEFDMSSLSISPYKETLSYWSQKLSRRKERIKFLFTKIVEISAFKSIKSEVRYSDTEFIDFQEATNNNVPEDPKVTVVVPVYIRKEKDIRDISNLFYSLDEQIQKPDHIIMIDDCSPVSFTYPKKDNIIYHKLLRNSGPAKARNKGKQIALECNSDIIAFTDADCILSKNWIKSMRSAFIESNFFDILSGNTISFEKNWFGLYHNINGTLNGRKFKNSERLLYGTTANLAITKDVASIIDFNENFPLAAGEDIDFCFRANKAGFAIKYFPEMTIFHNYGYGHNPLNNLKKFRQQFIRYAQGEKVLLKSIPEYYAYFDRTEEISAEVNGA